MSSDLFPYLYAVLAFPAFLGWAALQDFVAAATSPVERAHVRRVASALLLVGLAHPAVALVGFDITKQVSQGEFADEPGAPEARTRATALVVASFAVVIVASTAWYFA